MYAYLITFQLTSIIGILNKENIINRIKSFDKWANLTDNTWLIKTNLPRNAVLNQMSSLIGTGDKLIIFNVANQWNSLNLTQPVVQWLLREL